jgi:hypothetical protein
MRKLKLKEDEEGNKTTAVNGIRASCKVMKTRYSKPFESVHVKIPYATGMSPYSGLFDMLEEKGMLKREGNSYLYTTRDGEIFKAMRKGWTNEILDKVMADIMLRDLTSEVNKADAVIEEDADAA